MAVFHMATSVLLFFLVLANIGACASQVTDETDQTHGVGNEPIDRAGNPLDTKYTSLFYYIFGPSSGLLDESDDHHDGFYDEDNGFPADYEITEDYYDTLECFDDARCMATLISHHVYNGNPNGAIKSIFLQRNVHNLRKWFRILGMIEELHSEFGLEVYVWNSK